MYAAVVNTLIIHPRKLSVTQIQKRQTKFKILQYRRVLKTPGKKVKLCPDDIEYLRYVKHDL